MSSCVGLIFLSRLPPGRACLLSVLIYTVKHEQTRFLIKQCRLTDIHNMSFWCQVRESWQQACLFILNLCQHSENELKGEVNQRHG